MDAFKRQVKEGWVLAVHLTPNASRNEVTGVEKIDGKAARLKVKVTKVPEKGKANKALCELLAKYFKLPKSSIEVISGSKSRTKSVLIRGPHANIEQKIDQVLRGIGI